ncbi:MAG: hypothetical protein P4L83_04335 [Nevskia sp.]|nr:hypothetical protein [Nevskia sp.]
MSQHKQHSVMIARPPRREASVPSPAVEVPAKPQDVAPHFLSGPAEFVSRIARLIFNPESKSH